MSNLRCDGRDEFTNNVNTGSPALVVQCVPDVQGRPISDDCSFNSEREAEMAHFKQVCMAFTTYSQMAEPEISRTQKNLSMLSPMEQALLGSDIEEHVGLLQASVNLNQEFLNLMVTQDLDLVDDNGVSHPKCLLMREMNSIKEDIVRNQNELLEPGNCIEDSPVTSMNMYKVRSTLKQFAREWSAERAEERKAAFGPLINALHKYLPLEEYKRKHGRTPWVLCPGSGLGRLPFDVVCQGYSCQGNEFSYFMLLGSNFILNYALEPNSLAIQPFCLNSSNRRNKYDHLHTFTVPDVSASGSIAEGVDFSMCAGDFVEVYSTQRQEWDAVLTCFFLDTAKNIIRYVHTIANLLPPGGLWANLGPLLYHFADSAGEMSIELSWEELRSIICLYFTIVEEEWIDCFYTTAPRSMLQVIDPVHV